MWTIYNTIIHGCPALELGNPLHVGAGFFHVEWKEIDGKRDSRERSKADIFK